MKTHVIREVSGFRKVLLKFGFKNLDGYKLSYSNEKNGWFADIIDFGNFAEVWLVGTGLKDGGFPGGWNYADPKDIEKALNSALKII